eukprot:gene49163-49738_t
MRDAVAALRGAGVGFVAELGDFKDTNCPTGGTRLGAPNGSDAGAQGYVWVVHGDETRNW